MTMNQVAADSSAVQLFHSLADPARLSIMRLLAGGERRVVELTGELDLAQSTVSGHLRCLLKAGLVEAHPHGRSTYYALARPELWALMVAAEQLLKANGSPVRLCPEHHRPEHIAPCGDAVHGCLAHAARPEKPAKLPARPGRPH